MEVYIPPSRAHKASALSLGLTQELPDDLGLLEDAAKEIENAISHLKRSNREIQEFDPVSTRQQKPVCMQEKASVSEGRDPELVDAIAGNIVALAAKEERLRKLRDKMRALGAAGPDPCANLQQNTAAAAAAAAAADSPLPATETTPAEPTEASSESPRDKKDDAFADGVYL